MQDFLSCSFGTTGQNCRKSQPKTTNFLPKEKFMGQQPQNSVYGSLELHPNDKFCFDY